MSDLTPIPALSHGGSLAEQVRDSLMSAISDGTLAPGTRLREIPLSEHFGLSKTPVREGLRLLEADGVVQVLPRRGAVVMALDAEAIGHLYGLRLILEVAAAREAAGSKEPIDALTTLHRQMSQVLDEESQPEFHRLDIQLHHQIAGRSQNPELSSAIDRVHQRIQAARFRSAVVSRLRRAHDQHGDLIAAIGAGDADAAADAMTFHIESAREHVLTFLAQQ